MMGTFLCLLSIAVIAARAESTKSPKEIYMKCGSEKAINCSRKIEKNDTTLAPENECREFNETRKCVEQLCGPMPEMVLNILEIHFIKRNITCHIRVPGGNNSTGTGSGGNNFSDIGSVGAVSSGCADIKIDFSLVATYISFLTIINFI